MQEADIRFLKQKCNMLIEKALQLEQEKKNNELKICRLKEEKKVLEEKLRKQKNTSPEKTKIQVTPQINLMSEHKNDLSEAILKEDLSEQPRQNFEVAVRTSDNMVTVRERESVSQETILAMIQRLSTQLDNQPREEIVIRHISTGGKILELASDAIGKIAKILILGGIMALLSLAATVLLNQNLRNMLIEFVRNCIG